MHQYVLEKNQPESSLGKGLLVDTEVNTRQQHALAAKHSLVNDVLGCSRRSWRGPLPPAWHWRGHTWSTVPVLGPSG